MIKRKKTAFFLSVIASLFSFTLWILFIFHASNLALDDVPI